MASATRLPPPPPDLEPPAVSTLPDDALDALRARHEHAAHGARVDRRAAMTIEVALREALVVADFILRRWEPAVDDHGRPFPGLAGGGALFSRAVALEIRELHALASAEHRAAARGRRESLAALCARGAALVRELDAAAVYLRDVHQAAGVAEALRRVRAARAAAGESAEARAEGLDACARLLEAHRGALAGVAAFRAAALDEAAETAEALRERPAQKAARRGDLLRDGYLALIAERVRQARAAARFVFRAHPEVVREATSAWERERRRKRKR